MALKCANPECTASFDYREGQLLRVRISKSEGEKAKSGKRPGVRHYWLCRECCSVYALARDPRKGVLITRQFSAERREERIEVAT